MQEDLMHFLIVERDKGMGETETMAAVDTHLCSVATLSMMVPHKHDILLCKTVRFYNFHHGAYTFNGDMKTVCLQLISAKNLSLCPKPFRGGHTFSSSKMLNLMPKLLVQD